MSRNTGTFNFAANLEGLLKGPIDGKQLVNSYSALTSPSTWNQSGNVWLYNGAIVSVANDSNPINNSIYYLNDVDNYTMSCSWVKAGSGSSILTGATNGLSLVSSGTSIALGGLLTGNTYFSGYTLNYAADYSGSYSLRSIPDVGYVNSVASGLLPKAAVLVATTTGITLSGLTTIDGVTLSIGDRVLVKNQASGATNGIYNANTGVWTRTSDFDGTPSGETLSGNYMWVLSGDTNANTAWVLNTPDPIIIGTTSLSFVLFSHVADVIAGTGIDVVQSGGTHIISLNDYSQSVINTAITGATNGLTISGRNIILGGVLTNDTVFNGTGSSYHLKYAGDYSSNYTARSIPDAAWVTGLTTTTGIQTANNGLTKQGTNVILGGALTGNTTININTSLLTFLSEIDNNFDIGSGFNNTVNTVVLQTDEKILVGGTFTTYSGVSANGIVRINTNGSIDNTFNSGTGFTGNVDTITLQTDGKILVGGAFTSYSGVTANSIIRLNTDGSVDNTFNSGTGFGSGVYSIVVQTDDKILVAGGFVSYSGATAKRIIRLNTDGTIDNTFDITDGFNALAWNIALQNDGKLIVSGSFTSYSGVTSNRIIRLNTDGTIDSTFNVGTGFDATARPVTLQTDGKVLVGGLFTTYSGVTANQIIRLNSDGTIDNTFNSGSGFGIGAPFSITVQTDDKILVGGTFTTYSGVSKNAIVRLNTDGTIDNTFNIGIGFDTIVQKVILQTDGKILAGGDFTAYSGVTANRLIKLNSDGSIGTSGGVTSVSTIAKDNGLEYGGDYSANYTLRSLPDVEFVTGLTSQGITTANNGLTKIGQNLVLGGVLTGNTSLTGAYTLNITSSALLSTESGYQIANQTILKTTNSNTSIYAGLDAGSAGAAGYNVGIGISSLTGVTSGIGNISIGPYTLINHKTGNYNVGVGYVVLGLNTSGSNNIAMGCYSMYYNINGNCNIALGPQSLFCNTSGSNNIALGEASSNRKVSGIRNISLGSCAALCNTNGSNTIAIGFAAGATNVTGSSNIFIGPNAGYSETTSNKLYIANTNACNLIYGNFATNEITLPTVKICNTPATGVGTDSLLVWNSTDKYVKIVNGGAVLSSAITGATNGLTKTGQVAVLGGILTGNTTFDGTGSNYHLNYTGDYSSAYSVRSIPDVGYVTGYTQSMSNKAVIREIILNNQATTADDEFVGIYNCNLTTGFTICLYNTPVYGQKVTIVDTIGNSLSYPICVDGQSNLINGCACAVINTDYGSVSFIYNCRNYWSAVSFIN